MKGKIVGFTPSTGTGAISADDGERYAFEAAQWRSEKPIAAGTSVDFVGNGGAAAEIYPVSGIAPGLIDSSALAASPVVQKLKVLVTATLSFPLALLVIAAFFMPAISSPVHSASFMNLSEFSALLNMGQSHGSELESLKKAAAGLDVREAELNAYIIKSEGQRPPGFDSRAAIADYYIRDAKSQLENLAGQRTRLEELISDKRSAATMETAQILRFLAPLLAIFLLWRAWSEATLRLPTLATGAAAILAALLVWGFKASLGTGAEPGSIGAMMDQKIQSVISVGFGAWLMLVCGIGLVLTGLGRLSNPLAGKVA